MAKAKRPKKAKKVQNRPASVPVQDHAKVFEQLLNDAIFGTKKVERRRDK